MKRTILAMYLGGFLLGAESPARNEGTKLQPYQEAALANALRGWDARRDQGVLRYLDPRSSKSQRVPHLMAKANTQPAELQCAIPLVEAHANRALDSRMQVRVKRDSSLSDPMPNLKGLPVCRNEK